MFGDILAPKTVLLLAFFRASVAWCFSLAFGQFFVRLSFCLKDVRAPRANGAHADYIIKTHGFKHIFKLCFRAGERRGEQNTHGSGKKTHAKTAPKKTYFLVTFLFFFRSRRPNRQKAPQMTSQTPSGTLPGTLQEAEIDPLWRSKAAKMNFLGRPGPCQSLSGTPPGSVWQQGRANTE